jgi:glutamate/aspartate transport system substrate-binding protein
MQPLLRLSAALTTAALLTIASSPMAWAQTPPTLEKIKTSGAIVLAYREASIPFSYLGNDTKPIGFAWDVCASIVEAAKKATGMAAIEVKTQAVTPQNRITLLQNGSIDLECGSTTNNVERNKQVAFATNFFYTGTRLLVKTGSPIKTAADLKGRKVVSTIGSTNLMVMRKLSREQNLDFEIIGAKDHAESALLLQNGRAEAFALDDVLLYGIKANQPNPAEYSVVGEALQVEPYAIMLRKDDPAFKKLVDDTLADLIKTGEFDRLYKKWFQSPIPPRGITLDVPMSKELQANLKALSDKPAQ